MINKKCVICGKEFETKLNKTQCCSPSCSTTLGNKIKQQKRLEEWLKSGKLDYGKNTMIKVNSVYRKYIEEQQNHKCAICGIDDVWNGKHLVFILDHIDGDANNHNKDNLRLICPNCDSQLDTYKSKNKHSSRDYRVFKKDEVYYGEHCPSG